MSFNLAVVITAYVIVLWAVVKRIAVWGFGLERRHDRSMRHCSGQRRVSRSRRGTLWSDGDSDWLAQVGIDLSRVADDAPKRGAR